MNDTLNLKRGGTSYTLTATVTTDNMTLADAGIYIRQGAAVFGGPPIQADTLSVGGGAVAVRSSHGPRDIPVALTVRVDDPDDLNAAIAEVVNFLDPVHQTTPAVTLEYVTNGGGTRSIDGIVTAGTSQITIDNKDSMSTRVGFVIRCNQPYWKGPTQTETATGTGGSEPSGATGWNYGQPYPTGVSDVDFTDWGSDVITIDSGAVGAWPRYTIGRSSTGTFVASRAVVGVNTPGDGFAVNFGAITTTSIEIESDPLARFGAIDGTAAVTAQLDALVQPSLFTMLQPGANTVHFGCTKTSGTDDMQLTTKYEELFRTAGPS